jgi:hypothetical protein
MGGTGRQVRADPREPLATPRPARAPAADQGVRPTTNGMCIGRRRLPYGAGYRPSTPMFPGRNVAERA